MIAKKIVVVFFIGMVLMQEPVKPINEAFSGIDVTGLKQKLNNLPTTLKFTYLKLLSSKLSREGIRSVMAFYAQAQKLMPKFEQIVSDVVKTASSALQACFGTSDQAVVEKTLDSLNNIDEKKKTEINNFLEKCNYEKVEEFIFVAVVQVLENDPVVDQLAAKKDEVRQIIRSIFIVVVAGKLEVQELEALATFITSPGFEELVKNYKDFLVPLQPHVPQVVVIAGIIEKTINK